LRIVTPLPSMMTIHRPFHAGTAGSWARRYTRSSAASQAQQHELTMNTSLVFCSLAIACSDKLGVNPTIWIQCFCHANPFDFSMNPCKKKNLNDDRAQVFFFVVVQPFKFT
jgi:hypothetical protein